MNWETTRHQVAVAGRVTNAATGKPVAGAVITIVSMPTAFRRKVQLCSRQRRAPSLDETIGTTRSRTDGLFYFLDLPEGKYTLAAALPSLGRRYGKAQETAVVTRDSNGNLKLVSVNFGLQPTLVKGKIVGRGQKTGVAMAEIRLKGSGERAFSDAQGEYVLSGIESGKRSLLVSAQGYRALSQPIHLAEPGTSELVNINLVREGG
jgi:hypothetical protein